MPAIGLSLSGDWTGVYDDGDPQADPIPFNAMLFDIAGAVWGTTIEPAPDQAGDLMADVGGSRSDREVTFVKTFQTPLPGYDMPITYAGIVSPDGTRIDGRWQLFWLGAIRSGPFRMDRSAKLSTKQQAHMVQEATHEVPVADRVEILS